MRCPQCDRTLRWEDHCHHPDCEWAEEQPVEQLEEREETKRVGKQGVAKARAELKRAMGAPVDGEHGS